MRSRDRSAAENGERRATVRRRARMPLGSTSHVLVLKRTRRIRGEDVDATRVDEDGGEEIASFGRARGHRSAAAVRSNLHLTIGSKVMWIGRGRKSSHGRTTRSATRIADEDAATRPRCPLARPRSRRPRVQVGRLVRPLRR